MVIISTDTTHLILLALLVVMFTLQVWYWMKYYRRAAFVNNIKKETPANLPPVSVVICARNEAENLALFLPYVLEQDYPSYEVIVVNDCSEDDTDNVLGDMIIRYPHLRVSVINKDPDFTHAKKLAMLIGIKAAKNDLLVFTDADCRPASPNWLREMASAATEKTDIIIGYGGYIPAKGLLNRYIRYETMFIAMQYFGMAMTGKPYMGVGRNLAYRKSFFFSKGGFGPHNHILSGDDDLFVNRTATGENCGMVLTHDSFTLSLAQKTLSAWTKQKRRHLTTGDYYKRNDKTRLFFEPFSRTAYYVLLVILLALVISWPVVIFIALLRLVMRITILKKSAATFNEPRLWFISLFFDILAPFITLTLYLTTRKKGKGRERWE